MVAIYLHGFASSPRSSKAVFFRSKLAEHGIALQTPDFNEPDFSTLTITRMLRQVAVERGRLDGPVALIGSSLGAFVAIQSVLQRHGPLDRLVLLAPALDFNGNRLREIGDRGVDHWRATDRLEVFHHAFGRVVTIGYGLYEDAGRYDCLNARIDLPVQIFQGRRDVAVHPAMVQHWAASRPNVELHMLDDDHQLLASLETIWVDMARFLGLRRSG